MVKWLNTWLINRLALVRIPSGGISGRRQSRSAPQPLFILVPGSNPSDHKLLTLPAPPPPPPLPPQNDIQSQGDRGLKIKKSMGGLFCQAK